MKFVFAFCLGLLGTAMAQIDLDGLDQNYCQRLELANDDGLTLSNPPLTHNNAILHRRLIEGKLSYELSQNGRKTLLGDYPGYIRDFVVVEDIVYTLGAQGLRKYNLKGGFLGSFSHQSWKVSRRNLPRGLHHEDGNLYIASGSAGLIKFDLSKETFTGLDRLNTSNDNGHSSAAVAVTGHQDKLYIAMTATSEKGFDGVLVYDRLRKEILNKAEYNQRRAGVVFPYAGIYFNKETVYLNNGGWIHGLDASLLERRSTVMPKWHAIPHYPNGYRQFAMLEGDLFFSGNVVMGCGAYVNQSTNKRVFKAFSREL